MHRLVASLLVGALVAIGIQNPTWAQRGTTGQQGAQRAGGGMQQQFGQPAIGGGLGAGGVGADRAAGLTQQGVITSDAAIGRNQADFVGRNQGEHPRSMGANRPVSVNEQLFQSGGATGLGGIGGLGGLARGGIGRGGIGGLGGIGGIGGFGGTRGMGGMGGIGGFGGTRGIGGIGGIGMQGRGGLGMTGGMRGTGFGTNPMMGGMGRNRGAMGQMGQFGQQGRMGNQQPIRTQLEFGFEPQTLASTVVTERFSNRLERLPAVNVPEPITVLMEGRTIVLRGQVPSDHERDLIGRLALLEPGVDDVRNELLVGTATAASD